LGFSFRCRYHAVANTLQAGHLFELAFGERLVHAFPGEIKIQRFR